ncbi:aldo/keto reductase [Ruminiclostridium papyrosolvens DSM 2782]|uniref:Aldo/keto reductase n=1 Tax=Ruminiclostridium papyrosolvens DSM 2782 TaxID=588581 RepID=F1T7M3_9FIRM|nr:aldo/keto reductase [Ruminiclostridium papyrosolvens]EGD49471.1 aldo/keto reductase [Ruminiclostridium papyrosolvens DSM 2782]WES33404.1 aldo/keto reductase [Ruminiclostridium papyrosolvens DSM 2782]
MQKTRLGRTGLMVTRSSFGALPIQRISFDEAKKILLKAYKGGINFYDTARMYTDSEEKLGYAFSDIRKDIIIATKSVATDRKTLLEHLETSLKNMKTDYVDILQLHNPGVLPDPEDPESSYAGMIEAKKKGMVRFVGITNHRIKTAIQAVESGLYDTMQFPLNSISSDIDLELIEICKKKDVGLIAMKAMSGGLITNSASTFAFLRQFDNVVPIWGIQREAELDEFLQLEKNPPELTDELWEVIKKDRTELAGNFCRACGYCMPCPVGIEIPTQARISLLMRRAPYQPFLSDEFKEKMELINKCIECGQCKNHCPYSIDTPNLLKLQLQDYNEFYAKHK